MPELNKLLTGYQAFYKEQSDNDGALFKKLSKGQAPKVLVITCSDSRISPLKITQAAPGEMFVVRNVANLVPPYQPKPDSLHGVSAALEFGVCHLEVKHIVVMGHSGCGGIKALREGISAPEGQDMSFIGSWMEIAKSAKCVSQLQCEEEAIKVSLENLKTFPWIKSRVDSGAIELHGWYFRLDDGKLLTLDDDSFSEVPPATT